MTALALEPIRSVADVVPADERTLGWSVLEWTATYLQQPDGHAAGEPWVFTNEQARIILRWYEIDHAGRFVNRRGVLRRMKGWGKDPFLAAIAGVELCGPCRFGGWDAGGLPVAIQHPSPWIQVAAVSQDQTRNTMTLFPTLFTNEAINEYKVDLGKLIIYARKTGRIEAVTSSPRSLEGGRASLSILNESQEWLPTNDGHAMSDVIRRNLAKSNDGSARSMEICNAHLPGEESVAELTYEAWRQAEGHVTGLYYDALEAPHVPDLSDEETLREALAISRGDSVWLNVDRLAAEIADPTTPEYIARRYYLNNIVAARIERWLPDGTWEALEAASEIPRGDLVVLGFDGSYSADSTALIACSVAPRPHLLTLGVWESDGPDWLAPRLEIIQAIRDACRQWRVKEIAADEFIWITELEGLASEGLPVVKFPQHGRGMVEAASRFYEQATGERFTHDADARLARHVANVMVKPDGRLSKDKKGSPRKIDAAIAAVMALDRAAAYSQRPKSRVIDLNKI